MQEYQDYTRALQETLSHLPWEAIEATVACLHDARLAQRQIFVMGNGGSASTATHLACDLSKNTATPGVPRFRILALNDNVALLTAYANDEGYDRVFAEQLDNLLQPGDVVLAISTSGNSPNVLAAIRLAAARGAVTIGWTGYEGGTLAGLVDISLIVPNHCVEQIEDVHLILEHMVTTVLRNRAQQAAALGNGQPTDAALSPSR